MNVENQAISGESTAIIRRAGPKGLSRLFAYVAGKEILIVGSSSAGKTKFAEYLRLGVLDQEGKRQMTYYVSKSPAFVVQVGSQRNLALRIRRAVDTPGQTGPVQHASLVGLRKPHIVIVMLDCSKPLSSILRWLRLFCDRLDTVLRKGSYVKTKLDSIVVVLNKRDKINRTGLSRLRQEVKAVLSRHLSVVLGVERAHSIPILECISVQTQRGSALIDKVIGQLAKRLRR